MHGTGAWLTPMMQHKTQSNQKALGHCGIHPLCVNSEFASFMVGILSFFKGSFQGHTHIHHPHPPVTKWEGLAVTVFPGLMCVMFAFYWILWFWLNINVIGRWVQSNTVLSTYVYSLCCQEVMGFLTIKFGQMKKAQAGKHKSFSVSFNIWWNQTLFAQCWWCNYSLNEHFERIQTLSWDTHSCGFSGLFWMHIKLNKSTMKRLIKYQVTGVERSPSFVVFLYCGLWCDVSSPSLQQWQQRGEKTLWNGSAFIKQLLWFVC